MNKIKKSLTDEDTICDIKVGTKYPSVDERLMEENIRKILYSQFWNASIHLYTDLF